MDDELEVFTLTVFLTGAPTGTEGMYTLVNADAELMCPLGALTRSTCALLEHRRDPEGVRVRVERRPERVEGPYFIQEVIDRAGFYVEAGDELSAFVTDYSVGTRGIRGVILRLVERPSEVFCPLASVFASWFPGEEALRGVSRDELLDIFGSEHRVRVLSVHEWDLPLVGLMVER